MMSNSNEEIGLSDAQYAQIFGGNTQGVRPDIWAEFKVVGLGKARDGLLEGQSFSKKGHKQINLQVAPVTGDGTVLSTKLYHTLTTMLVNVDVTGHTPPKTAGFCREFVRAVEPGLIKMVKWDKEAQAYFDDEGNEVDTEHARRVNKAANLELYGVITRYYEDPSQLLGATFFANTFAEDYNGKTSVKLRWLKPEAPEGEAVSDTAEEIIE